VAGRSSIGLDIGTSGVRAAELTFGKAGITLEKFGQVALPEGAVRDGEVHDPTAVASAIKELWSHTKFSGKDVIVGVANQKVIVRQVELPWAPLDQLKATLAYQVQDSIPMPVEHALLDFYPLEELEDDAGTRTYRGLLVAAARDMVMTQLEAIQAAGLRPTMVDLSAFAVLRSLAEADTLGLSTTGLEALVEVGARVTNIVVHEGGQPRFVRILLMGGQDITDALAERRGVAQAEAEAMKHHRGLVEAGSSSAEDQAVERTINIAGQAFIDQVRGSLDYFVSSSGVGQIDRIVLTGGGSRLNGLAELLQKDTRTEVVHGNPFADLTVGSTGLSPEQLQFVEPLATVPVGLALGGVA
jgi:type IV pilus assembly protein PilM